MAEGGPRSAGEHCCAGALEGCVRPTTYRVDPEMDPKQAPRPAPVIDRPLSEPEPYQLLAGDDAVLPGSEGGEFDL